MADEKITEALRDATDTDAVLVGAGVLASVDEVFVKSFGDRAAILVADENTMRVAGAQVRQAFAAAGRPLEEPYVFPGSPTLYAEYANIELLREALRDRGAIPVAIGSGTLNDNAKRAAYELDLPYMNVSTAASMDGYTAFGASIAKDRLKQTLTCPAPKAVLADLGILKSAPARMTASGHADLLGKVPAGADWILADALGVEAIAPKPWSLVQDDLSWEEVERRVRAEHRPELADGFVKESRAKYIDADALARRLERLKEVWPDLRERVRRQLMIAKELRDNLRAAGCPTTPGEIGLGMEDFKATYVRAQMLRRRYTVLDLATETGILEQLVEELFAPGGFWSREGAATTA